MPKFFISPTKLYFICIFNLLISCSEERKENAHLTFKPAGAYEIHLDEYTALFENYMQYVPNWKGEEVMAFHVRKKQVIKLYSLKSGRLIDSIYLGKEGPKSYPSIYDFHIHDENNIFLNQTYHYKIHQVDGNLNLVKTFELLDPEIELDPVTKIPTSGDTFLADFNQNRVFNFLGGKIYFQGYPDKNPNNIKFFDDDCFIVNIDMASGKISRLLSYPEKSRLKAWGPFHSLLYSNYSIKRNQYFISFAADEEVHVTDKNLNIIHSFSAIPENYTQIKPIPSKAAGSEKVYLNHLNQQYIFGPILYDEYRDLIYRLVKEPNPEYGEQQVYDPLYKPRNLVLMAFNKQFEKVAEIRLKNTEEGIYMDRCFVNEEGFHIHYIDLNNEDKLYYKRFVVE